MEIALENLKIKFRKVNSYLLIIVHQDGKVLLNRNFGMLYDIWV